MDELESFESSSECEVPLTPLFITSLNTFLGFSDCVFDRTELSFILKIFEPQAPFYSKLKQDIFILYLQEHSAPSNGNSILTQDCLSFLLSSDQNNKTSFLISALIHTPHRMWLAGTLSFQSREHTYSLFELPLPVHASKVYQLTFQNPTLSLFLVKGESTILKCFTWHQNILNLFTFR